LREKESYDFLRDLISLCKDFVAEEEHRLESVFDGAMECNELCAEKELPRSQRESARALRVDVRLISRYF